MLNATLSGWVAERDGMRCWNVTSFALKTARPPGCNKPANKQKAA